MNYQSLALAAVLSAAGAAHAQINVATTTIANGTVQGPVYVTAPASDPTRLFVVEQRNGNPATGKIEILNLSNNSVNTTPFWTSPQVATAGEQGLLGLAFHPNYGNANNGYFWVNYTRASDGATVIMRGRRSAAGATATDPAANTTVLVVPQPFNNHNGGWLGFGPDGFLYIALGDGGSGNDPGNRAQNLSLLLGKILRIDVDGPDNIPGNADDDGFPADPDRLYKIPATNPYVNVAGEDEIWAYGVRNPWRCAFDRVTGELYVADVGQNEREEVNILAPGNGPYNLGWRCLEGTRVTGLTGCQVAQSVVPVLEYGHTIVVPPTTILGCSLTGGHVYRGSAIPCLRGTYFFGDYCSGDLWSFRKTEGNVIRSVLNRTVQMDPPDVPSTITIGNPVSFGEDAAGEMYVLDQAGNQIFKIVAGTGFSGPDCNSNSRPDDCDIADGIVADLNANGIPDSCEVPVCNDIDFNNDDLFPDDSDLVAFLEVLAGASCPACDSLDFNNDGLFPDDNDLIAFLRVLAGGEC
jgi:glucose/arabinose dehydrogenase